jgi:uncharacterized protein
MQLSHELPDYTYALRSADGHHARVNQLTLSASFILSPDTLTEAWPVTSAKALTVDQLQPLFDLAPAVILLGTGSKQVFPSAAVMAACLSRGIGLEVMANDSAARTFNVLAAEARRVVAAFIIE